VKFKIGDKVNILAHAPGYERHETGVVCKIDMMPYPIHVHFDNSTHPLGLCPYREDEIELRVKIGEQLLFDFMTEESI